MQKMMYSEVKGKHVTPLRIPGDYHPNMDHLELIEAQITREGLLELACESITEAALAGYQEMILVKRREYFDALHTRYSPAIIAKEQAVINLLLSLDAHDSNRTAIRTICLPSHRSEYCLKRLDQWIKLFDWKRNPKNMNMDWEGDCMDPDYVN